MVWTRTPPCPKCKETKDIKVYKKGERHNKYYEDDAPEPKEEAVPFDYETHD